MINDKNTYIYVKQNKREKNMNNNKIYKSDQSPAEIKADQHFFLYAEIWSQSLNAYSLCPMSQQKRCRTDTS